MLVTQKFYNDLFLSNYEIATIGGLQLSELNLLEEVFLETIDFDINVSEQEFNEYRKKLNLHFITNFSRDHFQ